MSLLSPTNESISIPAVMREEFGLLLKKEEITYARITRNFFITVNHVKI